ncbi:alpha/beta-hydrolase [Pseudovirgaria hyperparasitica]|uniref:Alpha/beta-hydrolase n=1 Tax=Pseudovirgaria hyperparasitica TaxID=470096 RepID=A0A6A6W3W8_9PEZI|nr:alpha/beta-hydrolase [Pseudovirgaria hyperparasitica]KAF2756724.1 alpha/beta-hydrolase [Pseudovirgaria hyperparasitica]
MFDENPTSIQEASPGTNAIPLVLMHDGGGTTFDYHFLDDLERDVWGIHNPRFNSGEPWIGGLAEMSTHYIELIKKVIPSGPVILGGWSLGGMLALEMARQLVDDPEIDVKGMVMVDTIYPFQAPGQDKKFVAQYKPTFNSYTSAATQKSVTASFANTFEMLKTWKIPEWNETADIVPPPTALIRVEESVPVPADADKDTVMRVDVHRQRRLLGWELYDYHLIDAVTEITGHHYTPFKPENVELTSEKIKVACSMIQRRVLKKARDESSVKQF